MSYIQDNLLPSEKIKYEGKVHSFYIFIMSFLAFIGFLFFFGGIKSGTWFMGFAIIIPTLYHVFYMVTTEIAVTNKRVLYKTGIIARNIFELQLDKTESATLDQTIFQRIIGAGTLVVNGTGGHNKPIQYLANPSEMRTIIYSEIEESK
ncbi:MAG: PH domain-containing protein [Candidatus Gracilibacteria bacterium]|nr:PH domain-containing protein [Candidatus Gracilibacteria bacterium]